MLMEACHKADVHVTQLTSLWTPKAARYYN